jgi:hypothetical protein
MNTIKKNVLHITLDRGQHALRIAFEPRAIGARD